MLHHAWLVHSFFLFYCEYPEAKQNPSSPSSHLPFLPSALSSPPPFQTSSVTIYILVPSLFLSLSQTWRKSQMSHPQSSESRTCKTSFQDTVPETLVANPTTRESLCSGDLSQEKGLLGQKRDHTCHWVHLVHPVRHSTPLCVKMNPMSRTKQSAFFFFFIIILKIFA